MLLPRAKAGARVVVLSEAAQTILRAHLEGRTSEWVFPNPDGVPYSRVHISRVFRKAARAAGLRDFHFHDLRHHGATMALNAGGDGSDAPGGGRGREWRRPWQQSVAAAR